MQSPRIAIIDNAIDHSVYTPVEHWRKHLPEPSEAFCAKAGELPDLGSHKYTHLILTGSEASIMEREPWVEQEKDFVADAVSRGLSVLASCYGHQLLALALSGPKSIRRCSAPEMGWLPIRINRDNRLLGFQSEFYAYTLHFDEVTNLDENYHTLASTEPCPVHVFQRKGKPVWGIQSHPEIDIEDGRRLFENLIQNGGAAQAQYRAGLGSSKIDTGMIRRIVRVFLEPFKETGV
jgi:GMP synthase-like glutamine amidotransferase